ncbi:cell division protein ZipA [Shewanella eurypsychrophilus]|uniref:Cell division protein ZipA n=1 Tax=Shewanella eurypsychrophilus TaxID=2593656 RepID=A0ABX6V7D0_9GAMM|nr:MULTISPECIES: cell division protein ZipA [Shewanella]QFU23298.1 cell division protein ZipA [Shewanella sp. YLB-09]QPG58527.1 cell division protein ZipA [Shewanella eurypsychrophilus]
MENLQLVLFVLGAIAIIAVLVHGFWSIRKQQPKSIKDSPMSGFYKDQAASRDANGFDADGIGEVRIRKSELNEDDEVLTEPSLSDTINSEPKFSTATESLSQTDVEMTIENERDFSLSDQPKQKMSRQRQEPVLSDQTQELDDLNQMELGLGQEAAPAQSSLFESDTKFEAESVELETEVDTASPIYATPVTEPRRQAAPKPKPKIKVVAEPQVKVEAKIQQDTETLAEPRDVLVLHVVASEGHTLNGAELLPCLLTLNFKFGDMSIFHRHEDNAGTGKELFSLANMVKPGIFNPDEMEQFSTEGVVLFMTLPCHGDPLMNFSIMLNSAHQLADDLGGKVLDGGRDAWSETTKQSYLQRIRTQL